MKKILFVLPSHDQLGNTGQKTGFWLEELASPYYEYIDNGYDVTIASPKGGRPPVDPKSLQPENQTESTKRLQADKSANEKLDNSLVLRIFHLTTMFHYFCPEVMVPCGIYRKTMI